MQQMLAALRKGLDSGWREALVVMLLLLFAQLLFRWALNRRSRPADRSAVLNPLLYLGALAIYFFVRHLHQDRIAALIIAVGVILGGLLTARREGQRTPWIATLVLAGLTGMGLHLSAMAFALAAFIALFLSAPASR
jgi:hypothetical protein